MGVEALELQPEKSKLQLAFPEVDPGLSPYGSRILVQLRTAKTKTDGGIILTSESRETEADNTQIARVIAIGPVAFKNRDTLESWPEGDWCKPGTFVRCKMYGGDRFSCAVPGSRDRAKFMFVNDMEIIAEVTGDPLAIKAYID